MTHYEIGDIFTLKPPEQPVKRVPRLTKQELEAIREALGHTLADEYDGDTPIEAFHSAREKINQQLERYDNHAKR